MSIQEFGTVSVGNAPSHAQPREQMGLWDVVSLLIGIVVGVTIFKVPGAVFSLSGGPVASLGLWAVGALLALAGALCYCELAAAYPQFGAEYVFLGRAYGRMTAFLFGWMQTCIVIPGSIGAMAFVFVDYAAPVWPVAEHYPGWIAAGVISVLTALQLIGFRVGKTAQNVLTAVKVISLAAVLVCGLLLTPASMEVVVAETATPRTWDGIGLALVFVLYAYGGWNDVATVTPDVRDCRRTMPRGLILGLTFTAILYLLLNLSFLKGLGYAGVCTSRSPAADVIRLSLGQSFSVLMSWIVMASALGAINGMLFSGCRLLTAVGDDFPLFRNWSRWNARQVPVWSLLTISGISLLLTGVVGIAAGRKLLDASLTFFLFPAPDWDRFGGGFEVLVAASAPIFWVFFCLSGLSLIVLRYRDPHRSRPFRVPLYPFTPLLFSLTAAYMFWSSWDYAGRLTALMLPVLGLGLLLAVYQMCWRRDHAHNWPPDS